MLQRTPLAPATQVLRERLRGRIALQRIVRQRLLEDAVDVARERRDETPRRGAAEPPDRFAKVGRGGAVDLARAARLVAVALYAGHELVQHEADRVDVARGRDGATGALLGARVCGREQARARHGRVALAEQLRDAEIEQLRRAVLADEDVAGLEVAVHDEVRMRVLHRGEHALEQPQPLGERQRAPVAPWRDRLAVDVFHREVGRAVVGGTRVDEGRDVGMIEPREDLPLGEKALEARAHQGARLQELQRNPLGIGRCASFGEPHGAHAALAELAHQHVVGDAAAREILRCLRERPREISHRLAVAVVRGLGAVVDQAPEVVGEARVGMREQGDRDAALGLGQALEPIELGEEALVPRAGLGAHRLAPYACGAGKVRNATNALSRGGGIGQTPAEFDVGRSMKDRSSASPRALAHAVTAILLFGSIAAPHGADAAAVYPLSGLTGPSGFRIEGVAAGDRSGYAVANAGDVNADGIDDVIVGACGHCDSTDLPATGAGRAYVVFGKSTGFTSPITLASLDGTNGFRLDGAAADERAGIVVAAAGDVNGDTFADVIVGALRADPGAVVDAGSAYVVFGKNTAFAATLALASLDGNNGFRIDGAATSERLGYAVAGVRDVNGDGFGDVLVGAPGAFSGATAGNAYVVFGHTGAFTPALSVAALDGNNGFRLAGDQAGDLTGAAVAAAGDVNRDGRRDLIVGAPFADPTAPFSGASYVVFGRAAGGFGASLALASLNGTTGFRLDGVAFDDRSGSAVAAAGDVNADGGDDVVIGAFAADRPGANAAGASYIVFGRTAAFPATFPLASLDGTNGFRIDGAAAGDVAGRAVSAGDVNGDGADDLAIGADLADPNGTESGSSYLVFGHPAPFTAAIGLASLDGSTGVRFDGTAAFDRSGFALSRAGDVNDDGIDDLVIGAERADPSGSESGASYVVLGNAAPLRSGAGSVALPDVVEDPPTPPAGTRLDTVLAPIYLDAQPLAGVGIDATPATANGAWQYSIDTGMNWLPIPAALSSSSALVLAPDAQVRFLPVANFSGNSPPLVARMWDGADGHTPGEGRNITASIASLGGFSNAANAVPLVVPVTPVNDVPSFAASNPPSVVATGVEITIPAWALFSAGPPSESSQVVDTYFVGGVTNPSLFTQPPVVDPNGTLRYTPVAAAVGTSMFTVRVRDNGGTANGGVDTSAPQTFTITLTSAGDALFANDFE